MTNEWKELTTLTRGARIAIERVRVVDTGIAIEGAFELPPLAQLPMEDQVFIGAFVCEPRLESRKWSGSSASPTPR